MVSNFAIEGEAELGIALVHTDRAPVKGVTDEPPTGRPTGSQHQQRGQGHPGRSYPPAKAPAR